MLLDFSKTKELLEKYNIFLVEGLVIETPEQGIEFARKVVGWPAAAPSEFWRGEPVVLKLLLPDDLHKIDKGLVKLNIQNKQQLETEFKALSALNRNSRHSVPSAELLVQKQVEGIELFVGLKRDKSFGPVVSFGLGGIFVEVLEDVSFGICPLDKKQAMAMIEKIKGYKILQGYRNQPKVNIEKLADILVNVSRIAMENSNIQEIDFNPLFASENNILVADAKII